MASEMTSHPELFLFCRIKYLCYSIKSFEENKSKKKGRKIKGFSHFRLLNSFETPPQMCHWVIFYIGAYNWKSHENQIDNKQAWQCHVFDIYKTIENIKNGTQSIKLLMRWESERLTIKKFNKNFITRITSSFSF